MTSVPKRTPYESCERLESGDLYRYSMPFDPSGIGLLDVRNQGLKMSEAVNGRLEEEIATRYPRSWMRMRHHSPIKSRGSGFESPNRFLFPALAAQSQVNVRRCSPYDTLVAGPALGIGRDAGEVDEHLCRIK